MPSNTLKYGATAFVLAGVLLALAVLLKAGGELHRHTGPAKIHLDQGRHVWILSHGRLHEFEPDGTRLRALDLAGFHLPDTSTEFYPLADGRLLIAEPETPAIHRCDPTTRRCEVFSATATEQAGAFDEALWLAVDEAADRVYVSDSGKHRLLALGLDGRLIDRTETENSRFFFPNHLDLTVPGKLAVTDTQHRRVVDIDIADGRLGEELGEMSTRSDLARRGRIQPVASLRMPDGNRWAIVFMATLKQGDIIIYDADGQATKRLDLDDSADPMSLLRLDERVLIADRDGFRVRQATLNGQLIEDFGDAPFQAELRGHREHIERWHTYQLASQIALGALPVLGILLLWLTGERLPNRPAAAGLSFERPAQVVYDEHWLDPRPEFVKQQKRGVTLIILLTLGLLVMLAATTANLPAPMRYMLWAMSAFVGLAMLASIVLIARQGKTRLGTDGLAVLLDRGNGRIQRFPFDGTKSDGRHLLLGKAMVPMRTPLHAIYEPDALERLILARIPSAGRLSSLNLFIASLRAGNLAHWSTLALLALVIVLQLLQSFEPGLLKNLLSAWLGVGCEMK